jgi:hypothetical protein
LPGCYVVIEAPTDGTPQRKYCTAAHRAIARQQRREGTQRSASAPPLPEPVAASAGPARRPTPLLRELPLPPLADEAEPTRARPTLAVPRRTRTLAMIGSAGLLITGTTLSLADTPHGTDATTATPWQAQDPATEQNWASEARVSLSSIERQLADVQAAARDWNSLPADERTGAVPESILDLARRKALLEQQRDALTERLAAYDQYDRAQQNLAADEQTVAELDRTLSAAPSPSQATPAQAEDTRQLREQRDARVRVLDEQRTEVDRLRGSVREVMAAALPTGDQATRAITAEARELVRDPARRRAARETPAPQVPSTPDQAGRVPNEILAAPSTPAPSRSGPSVLSPGAADPGVSGAQAGGPGSDVLAAPPAAGGLLDRVGGGPAGPGSAPADGGLLDGGLPVDPGLAPGGVPGGALVEPIESSVSGRTATRVANVAYDQAAPAPAAAPAPVAAGPVGDVASTLPAPAAPSRSESSMPDLVSSASGGYDPVTVGRAGLAAKSANDAISSMPADDNTKNLARLAVGSEILKQSAAENGRYRASGGAEDPKRVADAARDLTKLRANVELDKVAINSLERDWKMSRGAAQTVVGAARLGQLKPADRERAKRLVTDYAKAKIAADALSGRSQSNPQIESVLRAQLGSASRRSIEDGLRSAARRSIEDRFRSSARKSIEDGLRSAARRSIEDRFRASARKSIESSIRSQARKSIENRFRSEARKSIERSVRKSFERSARKSIERSVRKSFERSARKSVERSFRKSIERHFRR